MKQILELLPIALFFIAYKMSGTTIAIGSLSYELDGIFSATAVLIAATVIQAIVLLIIYKKLEKREIWTIIAVIAFGSLTLLFRNELFIQWKPTIFNWALAIVFFSVYLFSKKTLLERTLGTQMQLPTKAWVQLNYVFCAHFSIVGALNIYVAYNFAESTWVSYKLYSSIGFTIVLSILTVAIIAPYLKKN